MSYAAAPSAGGEFRVGNVLSRAMEICAGNFPFFFVITLIVALPNLLIQLNKPVAGQPLNAGSYFAILGLSLLLAIVLNTIGQAVILFGAFQRLQGMPVQPAEAFQRALARFLPLLGLAILYSLGVGFGMMLLFVPGFILLVMWAVVVPACVVEGLGPTASMSRSSELTKGNRWKIFGIFVLLILVSSIGNGIIGLLLAPTGRLIAALGTVVWAAVWAAYWNCVLIMIYHDLRVAKEGIDTKQIASVFD